MNLIYSYVSELQGPFSALALAEVEHVRRRLDPPRHAGGRQALAEVERRSPIESDDDDDEELYVPYETLRL